MGTLSELEKMCAPVVSWLIENTDMMCEITINAEGFTIKRKEIEIPVEMKEGK